MKHSRMNPAEMNIANAMVESREKVNQYLERMEQPSESRQIPVEVFLEGKNRTIYVSDDESVREAMAGRYEITLVHLGETRYFKSVWDAVYYEEMQRLQAGLARIVERHKRNEKRWRWISWVWN